MLQSNGNPGSTIQITFDFTVPEVHAAVAYSATIPGGGIPVIGGKGWNGSPVVNAVPANVGNHIVRRASIEAFIRSAVAAALAECGAYDPV